MFSSENLRHAGFAAIPTLFTLIFALLTVANSVDAGFQQLRQRPPVNRTGTIAVVNKASNTVSLVDIASFSVVDQVNVGRPGHRAGPHEVGVYPFGGTTLLITHYEEIPDATRGASVTLMDVKSREQSILFLGKGTRGPHGVVCVSPTLCIVSIEFSRHLAVVDVVAMRVVSLISTAPFELHEVTAAILPRDIAASSLSGLPRFAVGSDRTNDQIVTVDLRAQRLAHTILSSGSEPEGIAFVPILAPHASLLLADPSNLVWTANRQSDTIDVVDFRPGHNHIVESFPLGSRCRFPIRVGASLKDARRGRQGGAFVFVSCMESAMVVAYDSETRARIGAVSLRGAGGSQPANPSGIIGIGGGLVVFTDGGMNASQPDAEHGIALVDFHTQREIRRLSGGFLVPDGLAFTTVVVGEPVAGGR